MKNPTCIMGEKTPEEDVINIFITLTRFSEFPGSDEPRYKRKGIFFAFVDVIWLT